MFAALLLAAYVDAAANSIPMNGPYPGVANGDADFKSNFRGEYFEVYGEPITTHYSEVFWTTQPPVDLPRHFVKRYDNQTVSFTGFEVDIVRKNIFGEETKVPLYEWYNHHYCATIVGNLSQMTYVGKRSMRLGHAIRRRAIEVHPPAWEPRSLPNDPDPNSTIPLAQNFWMGNGGEYRKSFKYIPKGFGQLVYSPTKFILQPMLINTKNPNGPGRGGPLPNASRAPLGANYSGLMECPCTDRIEKIRTAYTTEPHDTCGALIVPDSEECFNAAASIVGAVGTNTTIKDPTLPAGCYLLSSTTDFKAVFNMDNSSTTECGGHEGPTRSTGTEKAIVLLSLDLDEVSGNATITMTGPSDVWFAVGFDAATMGDEPYAIVVLPSGEVQERRLANHAEGRQLAQSVVVVSSETHAREGSRVTRNHVGWPSKAITDFGRFARHGVHGTEDSVACEAACAAATGCVAWTFQPPHWSTPYNLDEAQCVLRDSLYDQDKQQSGFTDQGWFEGMVSGETVEGTVTTIVLTRTLVGNNKDYFSFNASADAVNFIAAFGKGPDFAYHGTTRGGATLMLVEMGAPVCICRGGQGGTIGGIPWANMCRSYPHTTILQDQNPSCFFETYGGGMTCCHHGNYLLDKEQQVPEETDTVQMKFRFYYEDPVSEHPFVRPYENAFFMFHETEDNNGEYDVPKCEDGVPPEFCVHTITAHFQLKDAMRRCTDRSDVWCSPSKNGEYPQSDYVKLLHVSPHCHGPACLSMQLINTDTGEEICSNKLHYGSGDEPGGEAGYLPGILPCIWGYDEHGLRDPPVLHMDTNLTAIKKCNSSNYHYGVMGHWQMRGAWAAAP